MTLPQIGKSHRERKEAMQLA